MLREMLDNIGGLFHIPENSLKFWGKDTSLEKLDEMFYEMVKEIEDGHQISVRNWYGHGNEPACTFHIYRFWDILREPIIGLTGSCFIGIKMNMMVWLETMTEELRSACIYFHLWILSIGRYGTLCPWFSLLIVSISK